MSKNFSHDDDTLATLAEAPTSRRAFLRSASLTAVGGALVACGTGESGTASAQKAAVPAGAATTATTVAQTGGTMGPHDTAKSTSAPLNASDTMDAMHEKGIKAFPAKTAVYGNQPFEPKIVNGVKEFEITATELQWETAPGQTVKAMAYNGQVPGPQIRVREGDRVRVVLRTSSRSLRRSTFTGSSFRWRWTACRTSRSRP